MAIQSSGETGWNSITVVFAIIATLDFYVGLRLIRNYRHNKKTKE
ncbi:YdiK family protein [Virgibacillus necropolis]|nr:YdiK family protein [Virgibacillus necropolis]